MEKRDLDLKNLHVLNLVLRIHQITTQLNINPLEKSLHGTGQGIKSGRNMHCFQHEYTDVVEGRNKWGKGNSRNMNR